MHVLAQYLDDHVSGSALAIELTERLAKRFEGERRGDFFASLLGEIRRDRDVLEDIVRRIGASPSRLGTTAGWAAEKLSRPKLKDAGSTGLGDLESLELLALGIMGKAMLWRALGSVAAMHDVISDADCRRLEARARVQYESVERLRMQAAHDVLTETAELERARASHDPSNVARKP
jgi:hypothetical protein